MPSPYQDFVRKAKERFAERQKIKASGAGAYQFTLHAQYKMQQYGLSEQRVRSVIRSPKRREEGIVPKTVAVMQPVSPKRIAGKPGRLGGETWKQEIWVMFQVKNPDQKSKLEKLKAPVSSGGSRVTVISAWRYPGVSPKRNPIPEDILREITEGDILIAEE